MAPEKNQEKNQDENQQQADENQQQDDKNNTKKKLAGKVIVLFIVLPGITIIAGMLAAFLLLAPKENTATATAPEQKKIGEKTKEDISFYELPEFIANLKSGKNQRIKYLKIIVALEYLGRQTKMKINDMMPRIIDSVNLYTRELYMADIEGAAGLQRIKEAMLIRINYILKPEKINDVLFKQILVQ